MHVPSFLEYSILNFLFGYLTKPIRAAAIKRRLDLKLESDEALIADPPKQPSLSNKNLGALTNILNGTTPCGPVLVTLHPLEKEFVKRMLVHVLDHIQDVNSAREEADRQNGSHIVASIIANKLE